MEDFEGIFHHKIDYLLGPTTPTPAPSFNQVASLTKVQEYANDIMTIPSSLAGLPSIALPVALHSSLSMPISLQLIGAFGRDRQLLQTAHDLHGLLLDNKHFALPEIKNLNLYLQISQHK